MNKSIARLYYLDILRIIATFLVIVIHICILNWQLLSPSSTDWKVLNIFESISQMGVPIFFMISGVLFLDEDRKFSIKEIYTKYILRLAVAFVFWSLIYACTQRPTSVPEFIRSVVDGHFHMWFIPAIIGCYMIVPFLRQIIKSEKLMKYYLILAVIITFSVRFAAPILQESHNTLIKYVGDILNIAYSNLVFRFTLGYSGYFVFGYYLNKTDFSKSTRRIIYLMGITAFMATVCFSYLISVEKGTPIETFYSKLSLNILLQSIALFVFAKYNFSPKKLTERKSKVLLFTSGCTFGIYLIHPIFIKIINEQFHITAVTLSPILAVPAFTITVFILSFAVSAILNKIPFVKKYIV